MLEWIQGGSGRSVECPKLKKIHIITRWRNPRMPKIPFPRPQFWNYRGPPAKVPYIFSRIIYQPQLWGISIGSVHSGWDKVSWVFWRERSLGKNNSKTKFIFFGWPSNNFSTVFLPIISGTPLSYSVTFSSLLPYSAVFGSLSRPASFNEAPIRSVNALIALRASRLS